MALRLHLDIYRKWKITKLAKQTGIYFSQPEIQRQAAELSGFSLPPSLSHLFMTTFLKSSGNHRPCEIIIEIRGFHFIIKTCISISTRHRHFVYYVSRGMSLKQSVFHSWPSTFPSLVESFRHKI